jgi:hypothetical protein
MVAWEAEAGGSRDKGYPGKHMETLFQKSKTKTKTKNEFT